MRQKSGPEKQPAEDAIRDIRRATCRQHPHPARFHQHVERALRHRHSTDLFNVGAGDRLMIGDDGERFERRARQFSLLVTVARQRPGKIIGGAEHHRLGDPRQMDAASVIEPSQFFHHRADVRPSREAARRSPISRAARRRRR